MKLMKKIKLYKMIKLIKYKLNNLKNHIIQMNNYPQKTMAILVKVNNKVN